MNNNTILSAVTISLMTLNDKFSLQNVLKSIVISSKTLVRQTME